MLRSDFVSNSSSCSFFVWIETEKDLQELSKIWSNVKKLTSNYIEIFPDGLKDAIENT